MFNTNGVSVEMETVKINSQSIQLPKEICTDKKIFDAFFSLETWKSLSPAIREHLTSNFLPDFCDNNRKEKENTINKLFTRKIKNFNVEALGELQQNLVKGNLLKRKNNRKKKWLKKREILRGYDECQRIIQMFKKLSKSRMDFISTDNTKLLTNCSAGYHRSALNMHQRSLKRYFHELENISMCDDTGLSSDDLDDYKTVVPRTKKNKSNPKLSHFNVINTIDNGENTSTMNNMDVKWYKDALLSRRSEKISVKNELQSGSMIKIEDIFEKTQLNLRKKRSMSLIKKQTLKTGRSVGRPKIIKYAEEESKKQKREIENLVIPSMDAIKVNRPAMDKQIKTLHSESINLRQVKREPNEKIEDSGNLKQSLPDLDSMNMMHLPLEFSDGEHKNLLEDLNASTKMPELLQETHACFLSLIRDILCSTPDHRMSLEELKRKVNFWLLNPITPLNEWYHQSENWFRLLPSAVFFLTGEFTDQPEDFVPYLEYKAHLNIYQWIGAGRDTDNNLVPLCKYWLSRRNDMGTNKNLIPIKENTINDELNNMSSKSDEFMSLDRSISPPPARFPTDWVVTPATPDEIEDFQEQERRRYEVPHMAFTYYQHGYESVVGPIKGIYSQQLHGITKARGHNMLVTNRPNFVTILTLVRDATARLPNGEGTRADICELLKSSQYINPAANDQVLQTIVSGALDRMHTESDPCVKYDSKRKIWIYLHRNRSEAEFEKMHLQQQCVVKPKKIICKKSKPPLHPSIKLTSSNANDIISEDVLPTNANIITPIKTVIQKVVPQCGPSQLMMSNNSGEVMKISDSNPIRTTSSISTLVNNKSIIIPSVKTKGNLQSFVSKKLPIQNTPSITFSQASSSNIISKVTRLLPNTKTVNTLGTPSFNESKVVVQKDLPEMGKIGIIPQKIIQVSPNRFQTNTKTKVITLNKPQPVFFTDKQNQLIQPKRVKQSDTVNAIKIPISMANYSTEPIPAKFIQVKPVNANVSSDGLPTLRRANIQIKSPDSMTNLVVSNKIINSSPIKIQPVTKNTALPVFVTKTSSGMAVLNSNRPIVQTAIAKSHDIEAKSNFGVITANKSVLLADKSQKTMNPVSQIVRVASSNSNVKMVNSVSSTMNVQQLRTGSQTDPIATNRGQFVNAKLVNIQSSSDSKVKTFSGIRMINASNLNIANINGKSVIIATKSFLNNQTPQNIVIQGSTSSKIIGTNQTISVAKNNLQSGGQIGQHIMLQKFQGGSISVKNMQGVKVIPFMPSIATASQTKGMPTTLIKSNQIVKTEELQTVTGARKAESLPK